MIQSTTVYENQGNPYVLEAIPKNVRTILDLGCGAGNLGKHAGLKNALWDGITISEDEAVLARQYYRTAIVHDLETGLPFDKLDKSYDICVCSHVLEHIMWPNRLLSDIKTILNPSNGKAIIALPNALYYDVRMKFLRGKFEYKDSGILDLNHIRWYTFKSGKRLLTDNGFTIEKAWVEGKFPLSKNIRNKMPSQVIKGLDSFFGKSFPGLFGFQMLYTVKPE